MDATLHFVFTGEENCSATVWIRDRRIQVIDGLHGEANVRVEADSTTWLGIVRREKSLLWALVTRRLRIRGDRRALTEFRRCFAS